MASYDPEFYQAPKFSAEYDAAAPKQRGCFFYGCVIASVLTILLVIALALGAFFMYRFASGMVEQWTSPTPMELPKVEVSDEQRKEVRHRVEAFRKGLEAGTASEPLVLTTDDLNALIEENPDFRGKIVAKIDGDKLKARVSFPLDKLGLGISMLRGRYLNGEAELKASLSNGVLLVTLDSLEVNGKRPPDDLMRNLRNQNLAKDVDNNPRNVRFIRRFESLEIKDGKIILKPRPGTGPDSAEEKAEKEDPDAESEDDDRPPPGPGKPDRP